MDRAMLLLAALALSIMNYAITPMAFAKAKCPDGAIWDQTAKKCIGDETGDPEEGGEGSM